MHVLPRRAAATFVALALGVAGAAPALAAPGPEPGLVGAHAVRVVATPRLAERAALRRAPAKIDSATVRAITRAVRRSDATSGVPASAYQITDIRVSGDWARATLTPRQPDTLDAATALLRRTSRTTWGLADLGTAEVGCDVAPAAVLTALSLPCD